MDEGKLPMIQPAKSEAYKSQHSSVPSSDFIKLKGAKAMTKGKRHCHLLLPFAL
jgi:hypothetical protein